MIVDFTKYSSKDLSRILFISNAIEDGWTVKKKERFIYFFKAQW